MCKKYNLLSKKNVFSLLIFTIVICLFCISQKNLRSRLVNRTPANIFMNPYVIPVGTQMAVPPWIMQQYQSSLQKKIYGNVLDYLIYNYSVSAPAESGEDTYYIPLSISSYDDDYDDDFYDASPIRKSDVYMVDVTKVKITSPDPAAPTPSPEALPVEPPSGDPAVIPPAEPPVKPQSPAEPPVKPQSPAEPPVKPQPSAEPLVKPQPPAEPPVNPQPPAKELQPSGDDEQTVKKPVDTSPVEPPLPAEGGEVEKPADTPQASEAIQLITTEPIDPSTGPPSPPPGSAPKPDPSAEKPPVSCDESDANTEADSPCVECAGLGNLKGVQSVLADIEDKVDDSHNVKHFPGVIKDICDSCGVDVKDFFKYIKDRAKEAGVPSEILFALVMRESNGDCKAGGDSGDSVGLFQLNTGNSTCLESCRAGALKGVSANEMQSVCEKGKYHKDYGKPGYACPKPAPSSNPKICLNNPYCNFEEAFHLLKDQKWGIGNSGEKYRPISKKWADMEAGERNKWRNAIVAYNGIKYKAPAEQLMKDTWESMSINERKKWIGPFVGLSIDKVNEDTIPLSLLDNWEFKRVFFIKEHMKGSTVPEGVITNLAHMESIAGREVSGSFAESAICQWGQFEKENQSLSCNN